jgi:hypothetical protein
MNTVCTKDDVRLQDAMAEVIEVRRRERRERHHLAIYAVVAVVIVAAVVAVTVQLLDLRDDQIAAPYERVVKTIPYKTVTDRIKDGMDRWYGRQ